MISGYAKGAKPLKRKDLNLIKVEEREGVKNWQGVPHGTLATAVVKGLKKRGLEIVNEDWFVNPKRTILWGAVDIKPEVGMPELEIGQDANFSLGIRHGNHGEYAVSFAVGAKIAVCSNGMFAGDFVLKKRHTPTLDIPGLVDTAIDQYIESCSALQELINGWRDAEVDDRQASYLILQAHRQGYVNFRYLETVNDNWVKPPHKEFEPRTAWSLYNAFTETAKLLSPPRQLRLLTGLRKMFDTEFAVGDAYVGPQAV